MPLSGRDALGSYHLASRAHRASSTIASSRRCITGRGTAGTGAVLRRSKCAAPNPWNRGPPCASTMGGRQDGFERRGRWQRQPEKFGAHNEVVLEPFEVVEAAEVASVLLEETSVQDPKGRFVKHATFRPLH